MRTGRPLFPMVLAVVMAVGCSGRAAAAIPRQTPNQTLAFQQARAAGFATPEDAIREYLAGVAHADVSRILQACAIDEMSAGFRFDLSADRLQAFVYDSLAPADYPFYADINRAVQSERVLRQVQMLAYSLLSSEQIDGRTIAPVDKAWADTFVTQVDPARLDSLVIADIRFSNAKLEHTTWWLANAAKIASNYGADELTERLVLFSFDGNLYDIGFTLLRYGDGWKVFNQASYLAEMSTLGTAQPTTIEEFDRLTSGE